MRGSRGGGQGVRNPPPPGKSQNVGFLSNTCPDYKATKPTFTVWPSSTRQRNASLHFVPAATAITFQATVDETNGVIVAQRTIKSKVTGAQLRHNDFRIFADQSRIFTYNCDETFKTTSQTLNENMPGHA